MMVKNHYTKHRLNTKKKKMIENLSEAINKYGFPIIAAGGCGYMIYFVWKWATETVKPILSDAQTTLIALIDRVRMLDNDLIRLNQKVNVTLTIRDKNESSKPNNTSSDNDK
jgi:hypothetical protein